MAAAKILKYENPKIEPNCEYCTRGGKNKKCESTANAKGIFHCRKFQYDPLKRTPRRPANPVVLSAEDFIL